MAQQHFNRRRRRNRSTERTPPKNDNSGERHRVDLLFRKQENLHFVASLDPTFVAGVDEREAV
jgi:hypothetical protein